MGVVDAVLSKTKAATSTNLRQRHWIQNVAFGVLWLTGGVVIVVLFFVIIYLLLQSGKFFVGTENVLEAVTLESSNEAVRDFVAANPAAIGYISFGYLDGTTKALALNQTAPSVANIANDTYPLARTLYMITNGEPSSEVQAWLDFVRSAEGQQLLTDAGYIALSESSEFQPLTQGINSELTLAGSTTVEPLAEQLAAAFARYYPNVTITVEGGDSTAGIKAAGKGSVDVGMSSRDIREVELVRYKELRVFDIGYDGIAVIVHPTLQISSLTYNQLRDIYNGYIDNWADVGGPDAEIVVVGRESGSGTSESFESWVMSKERLIQKGWETGNATMVAQGIGASFKAVWRFLTAEPLPGMGGKGGISTTIVTTVYMVVLTLLIATPLGVGAAVYLVEYAGEMGSQSRWMRRTVETIRFAVETLAGVPSIIFGLFGFALFVTVMHLGLSLLSGALAGACLILPVIIRTTEEALLTVPRAYREGSLALGATKWQTNWQVVLPTAMPGIVTGVILGVGRIVSETAVFYVTLGGSIHLPESVMDQGRTMVLHLYSLMMDANAPAPAMGTAMVLVVTIIAINLAINYLSTRITARMQGKAR